MEKFIVLAPLAAVAALIYIGMALAWPLWWVSVCSVLCVLVVEGVIVNVALAVVTVAVLTYGRGEVTLRDPADLARLLLDRVVAAPLPPRVRGIAVRLEDVERAHRAAVDEVEGAEEREPPNLRDLRGDRLHELRVRA